MKKSTTKIIGLTGGIGSGKTTAAKYFEELGFPLYNSDLRARKLQNENPEVIQKIKDVFGEEAYNDEGMNRPFIASKTFNDKEKLKQLNTIVHPAVFNDFKTWIEEQNTDYVIKEAAILIESGSYKDCDIIISVVADKEIRITRTIERDGLTREQILNRMANQLTDEERKEYSDYIIDNSQDLNYLYQQVKNIVDNIKK
ncbi:dephospho-CoA kinase [Faecalibacter macacae]|uniref:Dephospho-CoA kinase n=1 Tax=Faecalibacter macacae TaxID=1859289 RepID=A0A3L9MNB7_9FLAO|nr:dephospho-CoA kinase [Faecalibacter macacae]RLZ12714.1 dephospho-CoA kinase [Faecalibacter macacae]